MNFTLFDQRGLISCNELSRLNYPKSSSCFAPHALSLHNISNNTDCRWNSFFQNYNRDAIQFSHIYLNPKKSAQIGKNSAHIGKGKHDSKMWFFIFYLKSKDMYIITVCKQVKHDDVREIENEHKTMWICIYHSQFIRIQSTVGIAVDFTNFSTECHLYTIK